MTMKYTLILYYLDELARIDVTCHQNALPRAGDCLCFPFDQNGETDRLTLRVVEVTHFLTASADASLELPRVAIIVGSSSYGDACKIVSPTNPYSIGRWQVSDRLKAAFRNDSR